MTLADGTFPDWLVFTDTTLPQFTVLQTASLLQDVVYEIKVTAKEVSTDVELEASTKITVLLTPWIDACRAATIEVASPISIDYMISPSNFFRTEYSDLVEASSALGNCTQIRYELLTTPEDVSSFV